MTMVRGPLLAEAFVAPPEVLTGSIPINITSCNWANRTGSKRKTKRPLMSLCAATSYHCFRGASGHGCNWDVSESSTLGSERVGAVHTRGALPTLVMRPRMMLRTPNRMMPKIASAT
jgi:hypothetical protein